MVVRNLSSYFPKIGQNQPPKYETIQQHHNHYHSKENNVPIIMMNYTISKKVEKRTRKYGRY